MPFSKYVELFCLITLIFSPLCHSLKYILSESEKADSERDYNQEEQKRYNPSSYFPNLESDYISSHNEEGREVRQEGVCSNTREIHRSIKTLSCSSPILTTIKLKTAGPHYSIVPSVAQVKRCLGHCNHPHSCTPSRKSLIRIPVYKFDQTNSTRGPPTCVEYELEQHEECRCECVVQPHHCPKHKNYDASSCACKCRNAEEKRTCQERELSEMGSLTPRWTWDEKACECKCAMERQCRPMQIWDAVTCRCRFVRTEGEEDEDVYNYIY